MTLQLLEPEPNQSAPLLPGAWKKRERRGIYSGQFLTCTRIKTCVPSHQKFPKMPSRASPWEHRPAVPEDTHSFEESTAPRTLILRGIHCVEGTPFESVATPRSIFPATSKNNHNNWPHWYPPTFIKSITPPGNLIFQMLQQFLLQRRNYRP